ncbi:phage tail tube protein [Paenibacillus motobuensis]|uniref:phage tail tube protein n=1 Tax=Paenibacillus TaxID=44249 RepID=UPI000839C185|nr:MULTISPECIES: phage tail tube protein [Paenibacillus]MCM3040745.1 phage tail tube protein [Paenibacillus lutimineralis]MCM3647849.1 phage tail tube protein [Paenibacillus motobuensis]
MAFFNKQDAVSGKQGKAFVIIEGRNEELFYAKTIEATIEKNKVDVPVLGKTNTPQRSAGWKGSGTLTIYYVSSVFRQLMRDYIRTGKDFWFDLQIVNEQPGSSAGKQTVILKNCNLDSVIAAKLDATSDDMLDEELPFTFEDYDILDSFNTIQGI